MFKYIKFIAVVALLALFIGAIFSSQSNSVVQLKLRRSTSSRSSKICRA
jgi:branched-subunit amino acid transport protein